MTEGFAAIPNWIIRDVAELTIYDVAVYVALSSHTGPGGITPKHETIAAEARCSERQARKSLKHLEELGLIAWKGRRSTQGRTSNEYFLLPHGDAARGAVTDQTRHTVPSPTGTPDRNQPAPRADEEEPLQEEPKKKRSSNEPSPEFLAWYGTYPKRVAKGDAWKAWLQVLGELPDLAELHAATRRYASYVAGEDQKFTQSPAAWLRARRWEDDPSVLVRGGGVSHAKPEEQQTHWSQRARPMSREEIAADIARTKAAQQ